MRLRLSPACALTYVSLRSQLARMGEANQNDVDRLYEALGSGLEDGLPKGLSRPTMELIPSVLADSESGQTAAEVGELAGVSRVTARRYLDHLCRLGRAELAMRYGAPGRPEHRYPRLIPVS